MKSVAQRIKRANALLAPYAVPHGSGLGREHGEEDDETRFPFQRDRDRIIHTQAFRRLKGKTQVFVAGKGDHYRTRLTHTMECAQISRDMARTLQLNEDLAECIALAHDLGHTPFGHAGEDTMREEMERHGGTFEHNEQSLRVVTLLEERSKKHTGLNLNREALEGLMKHQTAFDVAPAPARRSSFDPFDGLRAGKLRMTRAPRLEAQIVNLADEIAYTAHDTDDGLRAEALRFDDLLKIPLFAEAAEHASRHQTEVRGALIHLLVTDAYEETERRLKTFNIATLDDVYGAPAQLVAFSENMHSHLAELRAFLWAHLYNAPAVIAHSGKGKEIIRTLFRAYEENPSEKVLALRGKTDSTLPEAIKDYIAGMTDSFATERAASIGDRKYSGSIADP